MPTIPTSLYPWAALGLAAAVWWIAERRNKRWSPVKAISHRLSVLLTGTGGLMVAGGHLGRWSRKALAATAAPSRHLTEKIHHPNPSVLVLAAATLIAAVVVLGMLPDKTFAGIRAVPATPTLSALLFVLPLLLNGIPGGAGDAARQATESLRTLGHHLHGTEWT